MKPAVESLAFACVVALWAAIFVGVVMFMVLPMMCERLS